MNQDVQALVSCIKKLLVYYKLFLYGTPGMIAPPVWGIIKEKVSVEITTEEQLSEVLALTEELFVLESLHQQPEDMPQPAEITVALDNLKSAYSKLKGE